MSQNNQQVNHPGKSAAAVVPAASTNTTVAEGSGLDTGGLVKESSMEQQQMHANTEPPVAHTSTTTAPEATHPGAPVMVQEKQVPVGPLGHSAFHNIALTAMFTLNLTDARMYDLKSQLSRVDLDGQEVNLYSPFRKAGKASDPKAAAGGIVRFALEEMLDVTDTINTSRVVFLGKDSEVRANLKAAIDTTRSQIEALFPATSDTVVAEIVNLDTEQEELEEAEPIQILLKDIIRVSSWINSPQTSGPVGEVETVAVHNAVINFIVTPGALYDATERVKFINQVENVLTMMTNSREDSATNLLLAINIDPQQLEDQAIRELIDSLLATEGFILYTRNELHKLNVSDWLPQSKAAVDRDLLTGNGDLLLVRLLGADEEEDADVEVEGAAE